ncbi:MAG: serine protease [Chthonomonas sp.]|nr:serine protease [Chthonomonas sp.]
MIHRALLSASLLFITVASAQALNAEEIYRKSSGSVMTLIVNDVKGQRVGNGTGFFISSDGLALTAYHVIRDAASIQARFEDGTVATVQGVIDTDETRDLALLKVTGSRFSFLTLRDALPSVGAEAFVIGAPKGLEFSITSGIVNQVRREDGMQTIQFSAPVSPGNSGSPLINSAGEAVGVVSYQRTDGQNLNFAVPTTYVSQLNRLGAIAKLPLKHAAQTVSATEKWKPTDFADTGLTLSLPRPLGVVDTTLDKDLEVIATSYRSSRIKTDELSLAITFFGFKKGQCPTVHDIAAEIQLDRKAGAMQLDGSVVENPALVAVEVPGADEAQSVITTSRMGRDVEIECATVIRKGTKLWLVVATTQVDSRAGMQQLDTISKSLKIK